MRSKSIFFLCLFLAITNLLVVSEVAARDLAETSTSEKKTEGANGLNDAKYGGYGPGNGYGGPGNSYGGPGNSYGGPGSSYGGPGSSYGGPGRYCRYGCCRREYYGRGCQACCRYAGEVAVAVQPQAKPHK